MPLASTAKASKDYQHSLMPWRKQQAGGASTSARDNLCGTAARLRQRAHARGTASITAGRPSDASHVAENISALGKSAHPCFPCVLVQTQLREFDDMVTQRKAATLQTALREGIPSLHSPMRNPQRPNSRRAGREAQKDEDYSGSRSQIENHLLQTLTQTPFDSDSLLKESLVVQEASRWLAACPPSTLRALQRRALCAAQSYFVTFAGVPPVVETLLHVPVSQNNVDADVEDQLIMPPDPMTFAHFAESFLVEKKKEGADAVYVVLASGRSVPVAPLTTAHLLYGTQTMEMILRDREGDSLSTRSPAAAEGGRLGEHPVPHSERGKEGVPQMTESRRLQTKASVFERIEECQLLLWEIVQWERFFRFFDPSCEGQCRNPVQLVCAVLLACAAQGKKEVEEPEQHIEQSVAALFVPSNGTNHAYCDSCQQMDRTAREQYRNTLRYSAYRCGHCPHTVRYFLGTPAVVLWLLSFLQLRRKPRTVAHTSSTGHGRLPPTRNDGTDEEELLPCAEVFFIRDWIAKQIHDDAPSLAEQETAISLRLPMIYSCRSTTVRVGFNQASMEQAVHNISTWAEKGVQEGAHLPLKTLLQLLKDEFMVTPYYCSFFSPSHDRRAERG